MRSDLFLNDTVKVTTNKMRESKIQYWVGSIEEICNNSGIISLNILTNLVYVPMLDSVSISYLFVKMINVLGF